MACLSFLSPRLVLLVHLGLGPPPVTTGERLRLGGTTYPDVAPFNVVRGWRWRRRRRRRRAANFSFRRGCPSPPPPVPTPSSRPWGLFAPVVVGGGRWKRQSACRSLVGRRTTNRCCRRRCHFSLLLRDVSDHPAVLERQIDSDDKLLSSWDCFQPLDEST